MKPPGFTDQKWDDLLAGRLSHNSLTREQQYQIALHWAEIGRPVSLRHFDLSDACLKMTRLNGVDLRQANLQGADLCMSELRGADLRMARAAQVKMDKAVLVRADLRDADLREADLTGADLTGSTLCGSDLSGVDLRGAKPHGVDLNRVLFDSNTKWPDGFDYQHSGAIGPGANLSNTNLSGINLSQIDLSGADLKGANLKGADLGAANMSRVDLKGARLSRADLNGANLWVADLSNADLRGADLSKATLTGAILNEADLSGADQVCCPGQGFSKGSEHKQRATKTGQVSGRRRHARWIDQAPLAVAYLTKQNKCATMYPAYGGTERGRYRTLKTAYSPHPQCAGSQPPTPPPTGLCCAIVVVPTQRGQRQPDHT